MISFALLLAVIIMISGAITRPIRSLAQTTAEIAKGNLDVNLPLVRSNDEVGELPHASFALGAPQSDDITLLALKYNGPSS